MKAPITLFALLFSAHVASGAVIPIFGTADYPIKINIEPSSFKNAIDPSNTVLQVTFLISEEGPFLDITSITFSYSSGDKKGNGLSVPVSTAKVEVDGIPYIRGEFRLTQEMLSNLKARFPYRLNEG